MCHHGQTCNVLTLLIRADTQKLFIVGIAGQERLLVELNLLTQFERLIQIIPEQHAQSLAADGGIAQQCMRVVNNFPFQCLKQILI